MVLVGGVWVSVCVYERSYVPVGEDFGCVVKFYDNLVGVFHLHYGVGSRESRL